MCVVFMDISEGYCLPYLEIWIGYSKRKKKVLSEGEGNTEEGVTVFILLLFGFVF